MTRAWIINAGNANCATRTGDRVAAQCVKGAAAALGVRDVEVLPASTGVIGVEMDPQKVLDALPRVVAALGANFEGVANAIMTTDTRPKAAFTQAGRGVAFAGMAKGAGMIQPRMATTLGFVMTDAVAAPAQLRTALKRAIAVTFNRLTVDGDTSTNDTVSVMASGASGVRPTPEALEKALTKVLESLAKQIAGDGEGARKLITIDVEARRVSARRRRWHGRSRIRRW